MQSGKIQNHTCTIYILQESNLAVWSCIYAKNRNNKNGIYIYIFNIYTYKCILSTNIHYSESDFMNSILIISIWLLYECRYIYITN